MEWGYFPLNLKNETRELHVLGKNFFFVFSSIACYLKLNTSNTFSLQCRRFSKPPSTICLNQRKNMQVICCQECWDDIRYCRATHLHSNTEHHIHYYNISLAYQPTGPLPSSCEDLCWPPVGKKQVYPKHWFLPASAKRRRVWTSFLVHRLEKYVHSLCWHHCVQRQKWNKKGYSATLIYQDCQNSPQCIF